MPSKPEPETKTPYALLTESTMLIPLPPAFEMPRAALVLFALIVLVLVNAFAAASWGTIEVLIANVPLPVIGPPVKPRPLPTLVTVPTGTATHVQAPPVNSRIWPAAQAFRPRLVVPPKETDPPPLSGLLAVTVNDGFASIELVTPPVAMLSVPDVVMGPPVSPDPLPTLVTVPVPGKACPAT